MNQTILEKTTKKKNLERKMLSNTKKKYMPKTTLFIPKKKNPNKTAFLIIPTEFDENLFEETF
jgi:hypothetical protein